MRRLLASFAGVACAALLTLAAAAPGAHAAGPPPAVSLDNEPWQFKPAGGVWIDAALPHTFDPSPIDDEFGGTTGTYRLALRAPSTPAGFRWGIRFEQIRRVAQVKLDGRVLTTHSDPYAPFTVPLEGLSDGKVHQLEVEVDNRKGKEPREGWWNWGGITRPARLVPLGSVVAHDSGFLPERRCDARGCRWSVLVDTTLTVRGAGVHRPKLTAAITSPTGQISRASATTRPLTEGESARVRFRVNVPGDPQLWDPQHPTLYGASLETAAADGAVQQVDRARIGLRWVAVRKGLLELNGRPIALRGASIQEDIDGRGPALSDADIATIVKELKAAHANVTRAHYALDERLLTKLDEAGIMVWEQAPIYHRDRLLETAPQRDLALSTVRAAVLATRNHPAVITHSVANELSVIPDEVPGTDAFLRDARALTLDLNPTLPTSVDTLSYPGYPAQRAYAAFDLLGINSYFGWYPGKVGHETANINDLRPYLERMRAMYPRQGLVVTEFGAESTYEGPADVKETYAFQENYTRTVLQEISDTPSISGAIYWTLREFAVKPNWDGGAQRTGVARDSIHNKGLITYDGKPKPAFGVMRDESRATPLERTPQQIAAALGTRLPDGERGGFGAGLAIGLTALIVLVLAIDVWALLGWWRALRGEQDDARRRREALLAAAAAGKRPRLRSVA